MQSKAATVSQYLAELPAYRRAAIEAVRDVIRRNLDTDCEEGMQYGMIGYYVPHRVYPAGYHCDPRQPLPMFGLASQKNYMSFYLMSVYCGCVDGKETEQARWFREAWAASGKKLDMGKVCIRFKSIAELALDVIGEAVRRVPTKMYIECYETALRMMRADTTQAAARTTAPAAKKGMKPKAAATGAKRAKFKKTVKSGKAMRK